MKSNKFVYYYFSFGEAHSALLKDSDIEARPMV